MIHSSPWPTVTLPECSVFDLIWSNPNGVSESAVAVIDGPTGREFTRKDLKETAQRLAGGLTKRGLEPLDVVCVFSPNSFYYHMTVLALQCGGFVVSGANAAYTVKEMIHQLVDSNSKMIFAHPSILEVALAATTQMGWSKKLQRDSIILMAQKDECGIALDHFQCYEDLLAKDMMKPHQIQNPKTTLAYLGYSSGTSGKAKGVRTSHYNMTSVLSILKPFEVGPGDVTLAVLPLNHIYGLTKLLHWPILIGTPVVILPKFELKALCSLVQRHKITICMLVPPIALLLAREKVVDDYDLNSLRLVISGAAPLGAELEKELSKRLGTNVAQAYGLTESSPTTHYCPISAPRPGSIGPILPMMRGRICDPETGLDVVPGEQGEMLLQGPNIMMGYLNRPDADAETLLTDKDGVWLKTGDIGYVDQDGYWFVTDRMKELIKYKGSQVAPAELEASLLECPFVKDAAVIGVWMEDQATELPRAYVVLTDAGKKEKDPAAAVRAWIDARVSSPKKLRGGVRITDTIPKSPSGKLLRRVLRDEVKAEMAKEEAAKAQAKL